MKNRRGSDPRALLGKRGQQLAALAAPVTLPKKKPAVIDADAKTFLPWLDKNAGPELKAWNALLKKKRLRRGAWSVARGYTFTHAVGGKDDDGCWLARVRSLFLAMSPILEEQEEMHFATWFSTPAGENVVWYSHQDEHEFQSPSASIASFFVGQLVKEAEDEESGIEIAKPLQKAADRAARAKIKIPPHLDAGALQERTDWIVSLFLQIGEGDGLSRAPTLKEWAKEKTLAKKWPHLQAYWLLFHLVMDNREELPALVKMHEKKYPAARELAGWARDVLAGKKIKSKVWDETRILGLRLRAFEAKKDFFTAGAKDRLLATTKTTRDARNKADAVLAATPDAKPPQLYDLCATFAGKIEKMENAINDSSNKNDDDFRMTVFLWNRRGNATILRSVLWNMTEAVDPRLSDFFEAKVREGAKFKETHEKNILGSITCLGVAMGDWNAFIDLISKILGDAGELTRLRRLELTMVAERLADSIRGGEDAIAFLRGQAKRFADQINAWETDTAATSLSFLLRRKDPIIFDIFNEMFAKASFSGANWTTLLAYVRIALDEIPDPRFAPSLLTALQKKLGRHDDGDRGLVARSYARAVGADAIATLEKLIADNDEARKECENASLVAGLIEAGGATYAELAAKALDALQTKDVGSMENGAAISLLQAIHAKQVPGFGERAAALLAVAKADKYTKKQLVKWLENTSFA